MSNYLDPKSAAASYRPRPGTMSPGLLRAREPYRIRNAVTGLALGGFAVAIWAYSISAVKQDVFDDIDEEARALQGSTSSSRPASRDQLTVGSGSSAASDPDLLSRAKTDEMTLAVAVAAEVVSQLPLDGTSLPAAMPQSRKGILQHLDSRFPNVLDPITKTLVWGAPPLDNIGTISRSKT
ncbi:hypothetical protein AX15_007240 [Amanita polypyramis BW_CC]|nr:hypothetical protein AX15_007240 [Amanita polypyramis BW_CC]